MRPPDPPRRLRFYGRLSAEQKREYDRSDARRELPLAPGPHLAAATDGVVRALETGSPALVRRAAQRLVDATLADLNGRSRRRPSSVPTVKVLRTRPRVQRSEFHGLYTRFENGASEIRVWMLTAAHGQVVKPRTFLRTLLHEVCHHVDMTLLDLPNSLHTLGFHARESSLVRALEKSGAKIPGAARERRARATRRVGPSRLGALAPQAHGRQEPKEPRTPNEHAAEPRAPQQLDLFGSARSGAGPALKRPAGRSARSSTGPGPE